MTHFCKFYVFRITNDFAIFLNVTSELNELTVPHLERTSLRGGRREYGNCGSAGKQDKLHCCSLVRNARKKITGCALGYLPSKNFNVYKWYREVHTYIQRAPTNTLARTPSDTYTPKLVTKASANTKLKTHI